MNDRDMHMAYLKAAAKVEVSYAAGGREALAKMSKAKVHVLYAEKMGGLNAVSKRLHEHPGDELGQLRKSKLELEIAGVGGFVKENFPDEPARGKDFDRGR